MPKKRTLLMSAVIAILAFGTSDAFARRGGGGSRSSFSSRSSGSSRSYSSRSSGSKSSWGSKSKAAKPKAAKPKAASPKQSWGSKKTASKSKPKGSATDRAAYEKAKKAGTSYKSRADAQKAFKEKHSSKYTSKYTTKPTKRPDHIPQTTSAGGKTYNITYNSSHGGYGYMGPSGSWIMYNAMADAAMMGVLMSRHNYHYGPPPAVVHHTSCGAGTAIAVIGVLAGIIVIAVIVTRRSSDGPTSGF